MTKPIAETGRFTDNLSMPSAPVNIFTYIDFRKYLGESYQERKSRDRKFSHRFISEKVKAGSSGWFADVVKGRLNLTGAQLLPLARLFELKPNEVNYLEAMMQYGQAGSIDEKMRYLQKMVSFKEVSPDLVGVDRLEFYSSWYHGALRELLFFHPFRGDYAALARKLSPPIKQAEARESLELLQRLGFVEPNGQGGFRAKEATLKKDPAFPSVVMANFLKSNMELAIEAMDRYSKEERDISALTLSLSEEAFAKVKEEIRVLRKRILAMTEVDIAPSKVFQCNIQFFPLSQ